MYEKLRALVLNLNAKWGIPLKNYPRRSGKKLLISKWLTKERFTNKKKSSSFQWIMCSSIQFHMCGVHTFSTGMNVIYLMIQIRRNEFFSSHQQIFVFFFLLFSNTSFNSILLLMRSYYLIFEWKSIFHVSLMREHVSAAARRKK